MESLEVIPDKVVEFRSQKEWEDKYKLIVKWGKELEALAEDEKSEDLLVKGCQSQVWLKAGFAEGKVKFKGDSDALLVKGLLALVLDIYSEKSPKKILEISPKIFEDLGLKKYLSPNRANGVFAMINQIRYYAQAFFILESQKTIR